jgi:hypothetical protein
MITMSNKNPASLWAVLGRIKHECCFHIPIRLLRKMGILVARRNDYYSPLPDKDDLIKHQQRWSKTSELVGVRFDLNELKQSLFLLKKHLNECPSYQEHHALKNAGFGPGIPWVDAMTLYGMVRHYKPKNLLEVGSGLSTYYASLAAERNAAEGCETKICCIEPYPFNKLRTVDGIRLIESLLQDVDVSLFSALGPGDILFIDSSHVLKIDGDVAAIYLEILPRLSKGVIVHIHDVHFPFNTPYPPEYWVVQADWPMYWNEAMVVQAFLCFNERFRIIQSTPLLRFFEPEILAAAIPDYATISADPNAFSSLWIERM